MSRPTGKQTDQEPLTVTEYRILLMKLKTHWQLLCMCMWETGVRIGELIGERDNPKKTGLLKSDIVNGGIWITREKRADRLREHLKISTELYSRLSLHVVRHVRTARVWDYTQSAAWLAIKTAATDARLRIGKDGKSTIHPHQFRHAFGYRVMNTDLGAKTPAAHLRVAQELLGHKDSRSTLVYTNPTKVDIENARQKIIDGKG
ncbi:MAG: tyrosine-type recombinase/integrase [Methylobacter tundripaludum]|nr:tyrosine-type recombinase/integrase [Methylobacter tundripaludum]